MDTTIAEMSAAA